MSAYLKLFIAALICLFNANYDALAAKATIKAVTSAPEGTIMRIYCMPYDATVSGVEPEGHFGMYKSKGEGSEITISGEGLSQLEIYDCELTKIEIVTAPDLFILKCYDNQLSELNLASCPKLEILECQNNQLTTLDVSKTPLLENLNASHNNLTSLDLGQQDYLTSLDCSANPLETLDVAGCKELNDLYFQNCNLSALDLSKNSKLEWVFAFNNGLADEKMSAFIDSMPEARTTGLIYIVDTRAGDDSNICTMENVRAFAQKGWATMDYLGGAGSDTQLGKFYPGCDYTPTVSERKITMTTSRQAGETITLNISTSASITISGVEETASSGKLTYTLTSSKVEISGDITSFECPDDDITKLEFNDPSLLKYIDCRNNDIESLNLTGATALTQLYCQANSLTSLDLSDCRSLMRVDCYQNRLAGKSMKAFVNSLPQSQNEPYLFIIDTKANGESEGNVATTTDVKIAKDKGWEIFDYANGANWGMGVRYDGSEPSEPEIPEQYLTITRSTKGHLMITVIYEDSDYTPIIEGGTLSGWNGSGLTVNMTEETVKIYGDAIGVHALFAMIEDIDVSNLPNLIELNVALNDITKLDVSKNAQLTTLSCEGNLISTLDLSNCPDLDFLNCYGNQIKGDNMTDMINSLPMRTSDSAGMLIVYDSTYSNEGNVCLKDDVLSARKKYWVAYQLTADDEDPVIYEGEDPAGIADITGDDPIYYDAATGLITSTSPRNIVVYNPSAQVVASANCATTLSVASLPSGAYVVRCGNTVFKIAR